MSAWELGSCILFDQFPIIRHSPSLVSIPSIAEVRPPGILLIIHLRLALALLWLSVNSSLRKA